MFAALAAALLLSQVAEVGAARAKPRNAPRPLRDSQSFALSADYTGYIGRILRIDGVDYRVSPDAAVYVIGAGVGSQGMLIHDASLYLAGERVGGNLLVRSIIVRPMSRDVRGQGGRDAGVGIVPKGSPF
jgi:hypothetical protein